MKSHLSAQCHPHGSSQLSACQPPSSLPHPFCSRPSQAHPSPHGFLFTASLAHRAGFIVCHACHTGIDTQHTCRCPYTLCIAAGWDCLESRKSLHTSAKVRVYQSQKEFWPSLGMLGSSLVQPLSILNASRILTVSWFKGFVPLSCDMKNICEKLKLGLSDTMF